MNSTHSPRLPASWRWFWLLAVLVLVGSLFLGVRVLTKAHAASTFTVSTCSSDTQLQADVAQANTDNANDTITFSCSGDIVLTKTLSITGSMTIDGSGHAVTLDGNKALQVLNVKSGGNLTLNALTIANGVSNRNNPNTFNAGGGIYNDGTVTITNSTLSGNSATNGYGGGIFIDTSGTVKVTNSTLSGNSTTGGFGGGIYNTGTLNLKSSTLSGNSAPNGQGGGIDNFFASATIQGSIIAENTAAVSNDCTGGISDQGYNLESGTSCGFTGTGSKQNTNPLLGPLANNGGPTQTLALLDGSPAIDQIPVANCPATDQRGDTRPDSSELACDMGAYESNYASVTFTVTNCTNDSQLQADVAQANADNNNDTITFSCSGDILLTKTLSITGSMTINGSGQTVTLDGHQTYQVLNVKSGGNLTLNALTIANGVSNRNNPNTFNAGGGIYNDGTVTITNSTLSGNSATNGYGGGIFIDISGTVKVTNSTLSGNSTTGGFGGGIYNTGTLNVKSSTLSGNSAPNGQGGGIDNFFASATIQGSIIAENTAAVSNDCTGGISDQGYNLESGTSCGFTGTGSKQNTNPLLGPLANNGGPTQTFALLDGSPAIDQIPVASCPATDQRGDTRPDSSELACDMGAYESNYAGTLTESGPTSVQATVVTLNGNDQTTTYTLPLSVADTTGSGAGWHLTITSTQFSDGHGHSLPVTASSILTAPTAVCAAGATCTVNPTDSVSYPLGIPAGSTAPTAVSFYNAAANTGEGSFIITVTVTVTIPASTIAGNYSSTLTVAVVSGP